MHMSYNEIEWNRRTVVLYFVTRVIFMSHFTVRYRFCPVFRRPENPYWRKSQVVYHRVWKFVAAGTLKEDHNHTDKGRHGVCGFPSQLAAPS